MPDLIHRAMLAAWRTIRCGPSKVPHSGKARRRAKRLSHHQIF
ncbi:MAG: hypothetical protein ACXU87_08910 [Xanthobacteraceae bacterium]